MISTWPEMYRDGAAVFDVLVHRRSPYEAATFGISGLLVPEYARPSRTPASVQTRVG